VLREALCVEVVVMYDSEVFVASNMQTEAKESV
jgi:hypothetical protein